MESCSEKDYRQLVLLKKINRYYEMKGFPPIDEMGYCHGITLLWLAHMADETEDKFYKVKQRIVDWPEDRLLEMDDDLQIQKFLSKIEFAQNPEKYTYHFSMSAPEINQKDIHKLLETNKSKSNSGRVSRDDLAKLLGQVTQYGNATVLRHNTGIKHTVGVYIRNDQYFFFDSNYKSGEALVFTDLATLSEEIEKRLYKVMGRDIPTKMNLEIKSVNLCQPSKISQEHTTTDDLFSRKKKTVSSSESTRKHGLSSDNADISAVPKRLKG